MTEPIYSEDGERLWERLPQTYRTEDDTNNWQMKRYLSGTTDQLGEIGVLIDRINYIDPPEGEPGDTSDLVDPNAADVEWLPWLAQLLGVRVLSGNEAADRAKLSSPAKFQAGTKSAIRVAAQNVLSGEKHVEVYDHTTNVSGVGLGGQWDVLIVTRDTETLSDPIAEVIKVGAKPAGVKLWHITYTATWDAIEAAFPTWADLDAATWGEIEEAGL